MCEETLMSLPIASIGVATAHRDGQKAREHAANTKLQAIIKLQSELTQQVIGPQRYHEPISALLEAWCGRLTPVGVPLSMLRYQREQNIQTEMSARHQALQQRIQQLDDWDLPCTLRAA